MTCRREYEPAVKIKSISKESPPRPRHATPRLRHATPSACGCHAISVGVGAQLAGHLSTFLSARLVARLVPMSSATTIVQVQEHQHPAGELGTPQSNSEVLPARCLAMPRLRWKRTRMMTRNRSI
jgi:hypothetical protein